MIQAVISKLLDGTQLARAEARAVMDEIMRGEATPAQIGGFLIALRAKGETPDEITGCAEAMRDHVLVVRPRRDDLVDTAGTGGDGAHTINISTAAALVAAAAGAAVAKHGNRAVSSACGSADVLEALGFTLRSALMNRKRSNGSAALTPLPKSAVAASRASGRRLLAGQQRMAQAHPHASRTERARLAEPAHLHRRAGKARLGRAVEREAHRLAARRRRHRRGVPARQRPRRAAADRARPARAARWRGTIVLARRAQLGRELLHAAARPHDARRQRQRGERDRAQELEGEPADAQLGAAARMRSKRAP